MNIRCKKCGGTLELSEGTLIQVCEYCGSRQTVPGMQDEQKINMYNRAVRLRIQGEYDRASDLYNSLIAEGVDEAELYWGLCLCRYGIEYVSDPATGERRPTCHRTMTESILEDPDFLKTLEKAGSDDAGSMYRDEASEIQRIQRGILDIVSKEEPYDVFICYKETGMDGERTEDSILGQEIYDTLTGKGLRVFFSRISLENRLGQQYEPIIYAALSSSRVMIAVATSFENYDSVWVKNEWTRYLDFMRKDSRKTLIPCYKDLDDVDIPKPFRNLPHQDMSRMGWLQDLVRGVLKLCDAENRGSYGKTEAPTEASMIARAKIYLMDGQWDKVDKTAENVLDYNPTSSEGYLIKLLAALHVKEPDGLTFSQEDFSLHPLYIRACKYGSDEEKARLSRYAFLRAGRKKTDELQKKAAVAQTIGEYDAILKELEEVKGIPEADELGKHARCIRETLVNVQALRDRYISIQKEIGEKNGKLKALRCEASKAELKLSDRENRIRNLLTQTESDETLRQLEQECQEYRASLTGLNEEISRLEPTIPSETELKEVYFRIPETFHNAGLERDAYIAWRPVQREMRDAPQAWGETFIKTCLQERQKWKDSLQSKRFWFGRYWSNSSDSFRDISWYVLEVKKDHILLLSEFALEAMPFDGNNKTVSWKDSSLRKWLNGEFLNTAFRLEERLIMKQVAMDDQSDCKDYVGLFTQPLCNYFTGSAFRCIPTEYAKQKRIIIQEDGTSPWWVRSRRDHELVMSETCFTDSLKALRSCSISTLGIGVRPMIALQVCS